MARSATGPFSPGSSESDRRQADARGVPAGIMMSRVLLLVSTALLVLIGLVMVFSASMVEALDQGESMFSFVGKQAAFALVGAAFGFMLSRFPVHAWRGTWFLVGWGICVVLLALVPVIGTEILGAKRWIYLGPVSLQPTEFAKIAFTVGAAKILYEFMIEEHDFKSSAVRAMVMLVVPIAFLFVTQSDLGSAIVIFVGVVAVLWIGEAPRAWIAALVGIAVVVGVLSMTTGYRAERIKVWLDPWSDEYGTGYQMIRSFYAFSEGGLFGVGLGNSREKFLYLPEAETDYIFSIIGEELGLVGALFVIVLFLVFLYAGLRVAAQAPDGFGRMMAGGLTAMLVGQAFLNIACAIGTFPTTGKPLPFVSSGGSSIVASLAIVGLIYGVSRGSNELTPYERRRNDLNVLRVEPPEEFGGMGGFEARRSRRGSGGYPDQAGAGYRERRGALGARGGGSLDRAGRDGPASEGDAFSGGSSRRRSSGIQLGTGTDRSYYDDASRGRSGLRAGERKRR